MEKQKNKEGKRKKLLQKILPAVGSFIVPTGLGALASALLLSPIPYAIGVATGSILAGKQILSKK